MALVVVLVGLCLIGAFITVLPDNDGLISAPGWLCLVAAVSLSW